MKKILLLVCLSCVMSIKAQEIKIESSYHADTVKIMYKTVYRDSFFNNFYLQAAFAGSLLCAEEDYMMPFADRIQPGFMFAVGKQITPFFGVRMSINGNRLTGWNSGEIAVYPGSEIDPILEYWNSQGIETINGYKQELKYYSLSADARFDMLNLKKNNLKFVKKTALELFVGIEALQCLKWHGAHNRLQLSFRYGLSPLLYITPRLALNVELLGVVTDAAFDGEINKGHKYDDFYSVSVGVRLHIGEQGYRIIKMINADKEDFINDSVVVKRTITEAEKAPKTIIIPARNNEVLIPAIVFDYNADTFDEELQMVNIFHVAEILMSNSTYNVEIIGNTIDTNVALAAQRADKIKNILVDRYNISEERIKVSTSDIDVANKNQHSQTVHFIID